MRLHYRADFVVAEAKNYTKPVGKNEVLQLPGSDRDKDVEILALRHKLAALQRLAVGGDPAQHPNVEAGRLRVYLQQILPRKRLAEVHRVLAAGSVRGKLAITA
jgi:hypothetical protein